MTGWEKEWPKPKIIKQSEPDINEWFKQQPGMFDPKLYDDTVKLIDEVPWLGEKLLSKQGSNLVDAEAYLYFQCESCDTILDPHTRSFARLQQARVDKGWLCVWNTNGLGYNVYCEKCGEGKK